MTFVEKGVNFDGGEVFLWVSTANFGQDVCVCVWGGWLGVASGGDLGIISSLGRRNFIKRSSS